MYVFVTSEKDVEKTNDRYIFTCTYNCEKDIYDTPRIKQTLKSDMINSCFDHSVSFDSAFSAREIQLEDLLINRKSDLKSVLPDISKKEKDDIIAKIRGFHLSKNVNYFVEEYEKYFGERNNFLWKFLGTLFKDAGITLSTVDKKYLDSLVDCKLLLSILYTIIDDVADVHKDEMLLKKIIDALSNSSCIELQEKDERIILVKNIWSHILKEISKYPRFEEFNKSFMYDFKQVLNATEYSCLINNNPKLINLNETEMYDCHGMIVFLVNGIDLMASPNFDKNDLPYLRTVFWHAQQIARIGNWLSTWRRELKENDISSGVFAYAISNKIITDNEIGKLTEEEIIKKIEDSDTEEHYLTVLNQNHEKIELLQKNIKSIDISAYMSGLENVFKFHMATKGLK